MPNQRAHCFKRSNPHPANTMRMPDISMKITPQVKLKTAQNSPMGSPISANTPLIGMATSMQATNNNSNASTKNQTAIAVTPSGRFIFTFSSNHFSDTYILPD
jgi:hypothetical protein